ncbi:MAG: methionyl-tRNA formyltransferase, partial [Thiobacillus sp.]
PAPGAWTRLDGAPFKILCAEVAREGEADAPPGTLLRADPAGRVVACGGGALLLHEIQAAGSKRMTAAAFLAGRALRPGVRLGD